MVCYTLSSTPFLALIDFYADFKLKFYQSIYIKKVLSWLKCLVPIKNKKGSKSKLFFRNILRLEVRKFNREDEKKKKVVTESTSQIVYIIIINSLIWERIGKS